MSRMQLYYLIKPIIPRLIQILMRQKYVHRIKNRSKDIWPICIKAGKTPEYWPGWPRKKKFGLILTHDVETEFGMEQTLKVMEMESALGFKSSFNFVPERYEVSPTIREMLTDNGFEVGVHGLNHDGKLYESKATFEDRARKINQYIKQWDAVGFRSPAMHHNLEWLHQLNIQYDMSTFDTDPFEPQADGVHTIFPFWEENPDLKHQYLEMPYTLVQDFTLFILMSARNTKIWKNKMDWIVHKGGMVLLNVHPDYMNFNQKRTSEQYPANYYKEFLEYIKQTYPNQYWHGLPKDLTAYLKSKKKS